ncbi:MAG: hypothetical protein ACE5D0_01715 [Fidelibacterota bacterium]
MKKLFTTIMVMALSSEMIWACATCFGDPDAPATHGMNGAIIALLLVIGSVLSAVAVNIVSFRNRAKMYMNQEHSQ